MSSLSDIKRRLASVKQTRQITGAMETVSVAKMRKSAEKLSGSREFLGILEAIFDAVDFGDEIAQMPSARAGKDLLVVLSSDKGLCGGFDQDILKLAHSVITDNTVVLPIGSVAAEKYRERMNVDMRFADRYIADNDNANYIAAELSAMYGNGAKSVALVYSEMFTRSNFKPKIKNILPIAPYRAVDGKKKKIDCCEPSATEVYKTLMPLYLSGVVYNALVNNVAAEHCARRAAMSAATESADAIISALSVEYNRARQAKVTEQIVEIIGSTEALKGNGNEKRV